MRVTNLLVPLALLIAGASADQPITTDAEFEEKIMCALQILQNTRCNAICCLRV